MLIERSKINADEAFIPLHVISRRERREGVSAQRVSRCEVIARVEALPANRTTWVGIDGPGGAGKSTLAADIAVAVPRAVIICADDFSGPHVSKWDWDRFRAQVLLPLRDGRPGRYQRWDWDRDQGAEWHDVPVGSLVVLEGVSSTRDEVGADWDLTVWVEAPVETRLARAVERDGPGMLERWLADWIPSEEDYIVTQAPLQRMDLVVSGVDRPSGLGESDVS